MTTFESQMQQGGDAALREASWFFEKKGPVWETLRAVTARVSELKIPYAIVGGMALNAHGYVRLTIDVDILVDSAGLAAVHRGLEGMGYASRSAGANIYGMSGRRCESISLLAANARATADAFPFFRPKSPPSKSTGFAMWLCRH